MAHKPCCGFRYSLKQRTMPSGVAYHPGALLLVFVELFEHFAVHLFAVDESVHLEIVLKTAEIKVGAACSAEFLIDNDGFGVQHPAIVKVELDACLETFFDIGERRIGESL